jgi:hypothetical protein
MSVRKREWTSRKGERKQAWIVDYSLNGRRHIETFKRKRDADAYAQQVGVDIRAGTHTPVSRSITVAQAAEDWIRRQMRSKKKPERVGVDIMFDNMLFWHRQSRDLAAKLDAICGKSKNEDDRREAMSLARMFLSARENAQFTQTYQLPRKGCRVGLRIVLFEMLWGGGEEIASIVADVNRWSRQCKRRTT